MGFGPIDEREAEIFAVEEYRADIQYEMLRAMKAAGLTQAELAKRMRISAAQVSQILGDDANLTAESVARFFRACGYQPKLSYVPAEENIENTDQTSGPQAAEAWREVKQHISAEIKVLSANSTAGMLFAAIQSSARVRRPVVVANDHSAPLANLVMEVA
ncbi:XRE family transcriptional regulator [Neorhizobium sp. P12A]|uniref:helix-turn-helix transcriptional regulator n=1 Tax=Neorhizobium sp. P12A TaxID=2268027 RepID=UPI0011EBBF03|nr:helix-turn-helix transcriptional regulator [Neorhizobium sp. P12A]KAA0698523.1 XRE family transcriptional regulator [Neorhizobium sp. P12A]